MGVKGLTLYHLKSHLQVPFSLFSCIFSQTQRSIFISSLGTEESYLKVCISLAFLKFNMEFKEEANQTSKRWGIWILVCFPLFVLFLINNWSGLLYHVVLRSGLHAYVCNFWSCFLSEGLQKYRLGKQFHREGSMPETKDAPHGMLDWKAVTVNCFFSERFHFKCLCMPFGGNDRVHRNVT